MDQQQPPTSQDSPAVPTPPSNVPLSPATSTPAAAVHPDSTNRVKRAGRILMIAGFMLVLFFFSPFVSCSSQTYTGASAFKESLPTAYSGARDGLILIILPIVGAIGALIGYLTTQRVAQGASLTGLRALGMVTLFLTLLTSCPIGVAFYDVQQSHGAWHLEWGYYGSVLAALALLWGGGELISGVGRRVVATPTVGRACPSCGKANPPDYRFCMHCGNPIEPPTVGP